MRLTGKNSGSLCPKKPVAGSKYCSAHKKKHEAPPKAICGFTIKNGKKRGDRCSKTVTDKSDYCAIHTKIMNGQGSGKTKSGVTCAHKMKNGQNEGQFCHRAPLKGSKYCSSHRTVSEVEELLKKQKELQEKKEKGEDVEDSESIEVVTCDHNLYGGVHNGKKCPKLPAKGSRFCSAHTRSRKQIEEKHDMSYDDWKAQKTGKGGKSGSKKGSKKTEKKIKPKEYPGDDSYPSESKIFVLNDGVDDDPDLIGDSDSESEIDREIVEGESGDESGVEEVEEISSEITKRTERQKEKQKEKKEKKKKHLTLEDVEIIQPLKTEYRPKKKLL